MAGLACNNITMSTQSVTVEHVCVCVNCVCNNVMHSLSDVACAVGNRLLLKTTSHGTKLAEAIPLTMGDHIEKANIEICKSPDGNGDWLLGKGASGRVPTSSPSYLHHHTHSKSSCSVIYAVCFFAYQCNAWFNRKTCTLHCTEPLQAVCL